SSATAVAVGFFFLSQLFFRDFFFGEMGAGGAGKLSAVGAGVAAAAVPPTPRLNAGDLKKMVPPVKSSRSNLAHGWLPFAADSIRQQFGTQMPQGGHPPPHSITSSARATRVRGTSRPSTFAMRRLRNSSTFVVCWTGRSAGLSPLRTRPV